MMKLGLAVLPLEVWADIFISQWITRQELAQFSNKIRNRKFAEKLQKLLHGCGQRTLRFLKISSKLKMNSFKHQSLKRKIEPKHQASLAVAPRAHRYGNFLLCSGYQDCEFPECEMPENIKTFKRISIEHFDDQVLDFLDKTRSILNNVTLDIGSTKNVRVLLAHLLPMLGSIRAINCENDCIGFLERHFPGTLALAKELELLNAEVAFIPAYLGWLNAPQNFEQSGPRFLKMDGDLNTIIAIVNVVCQQFLAATIQSTFVIYLQFHFGRGNRPDELKLENAATNEQLTVRDECFKKPNRKDIHYVQIVRHPMGEGAKMRDWIKRRAYYEMKYKDDDGGARSCDDVQQLISIGSPPLNIGHITNNNEQDAIDQEENESASEEESSDDEAGPSTSAAKKMKY